MLLGLSERVLAGAEAFWPLIVTDAHIVQLSDRRHDCQLRPCFASAESWLKCGAC